MDVACMGVSYMFIKVLKEELVWATDQQLKAISNVMLLKSVMYTTMKLKNETILKG